MEGLQAKTEGVKAAFENLANDIINDEFVATILDLGKSLLELADTDIGRVIVSVTLLTVAATTFKRLLETMHVTSMLSSTFSNLATTFKDLKAAFDLARESGEGFFSTLSQAGGLGVGMGGYLAIAAAIAVAVYELVKWSEDVKVTFKEQLEIVAQTEAELETQNQQIDELLAKGDSLNEAEQRRLELLQAQKKVIEDTLQTERESAVQKWIAEYATPEVGQAPQQVYYGRGMPNITPVLTGDIEAPNQLVQWINALRQAQKDAVLATTIEELEDATNRMDLAQTTLQDQADNLLQFYEWFGEDIPREVRSGLMALFDVDELGLKETTSGLMVYGQLLGKTEEEIVASARYQRLLKQEAEAAAGALGQEATTLQTLITTLDNTKKSFDYLSQAWEEFNSDGSIAYSTISKIAEAFGDVEGIEGYVNILASGNLTAEELDATLTQLTATKIAQEVAAGNLTRADTALVAKMLEEVGVTNSAVAANQLLAASFSRITIAGQNMSVAEAISKLNELKNTAITVAGSMAAVAYFEERRSELISEYTNAIQNALNIDWGLPSGTGAGGGGATTTTTDTRKKAYEDEVSLLESQLDLMQKQGASAEDQVAKMRAIQEALHQEAEYLRSIGANQADINKLSSEWYDWEDKIKSTLEEQNKLLQEQRDTYREAVDALASYMQDYADDQIDALNEQLAALEAANQELEDQITLQEKLDAMARARQTKVLVYKDGMFQYVNDVDAVSAAASDLAAFQREQEYQSQRKEIEDQIDALEELKQQWADLTNVYRDEQDRLLILQQLGIDMQSANFDEMLRNAEKFVAEYAAIMASMAAIDFSGGSQANVVAQMQANSAAWYGADAATRSALSAANLALGTSMGWHRDEATGIWYTASGQRAYAHGTVGATGGMSLVGEHGAELRVLNQGDGIIPADITRNLWGWGSISPRQMAASMGMNITIGNLNLPGVRDGEGFVSYLRTNFFADAMQYAH